MVRILETHGFSKARQKGSHFAMQRLVDGGTVTVVVPLHAEIRLGALLSIVRQSRLPRSAFEED